MAILALRSSSSASNSLVAAFASPLVIGSSAALETCSRSSLFFSSSPDTLALSASNSLPGVVFDAAGGVPGPPTLDRRVEKLGLERPEDPVSPLAGAGVGLPAADGGPGEAVPSRTEVAVEGRPIEPELAAEGSGARGLYVGAVVVVLAAGAVLLAALALLVMLLDIRRSTVGLIARPAPKDFLSGVRVTVEDGVPIAEVLRETPELGAGALDVAAGGLVVLLAVVVVVAAAIELEGVLRGAAAPAPVFPGGGLLGGLCKTVPVLRAGAAATLAAELAAVPMGRLAGPVTVGFLIASFCSSR